MLILCTKKKKILQYLAYLSGIIPMCEIHQFLHTSAFEHAVDWQLVFPLVSRV